MFPFKGQRLYGSIRARPPRPTWNALLSECILIRSLSLLSSRRRFLSLAEIPDLLFLPRLDGPVDPLRLVFFRFLPATLMLLPPLLLIPLSLWESEPLPSPPFSASPASCREKCYNVGWMASAPPTPSAVVCQHGTHATQRQGAIPLGTHTLSN